MKKKIKPTQDTKPKVNKKKKKKKAKPENYQFKNFYESETQLRDISHTTSPDEIIKAYGRLVWVYASKHVREGVELEDLIAEGQKGVCKAIKDFNDPRRKKPNYNFHQACLYNIRSSIFQYCLGNAIQIKTPYYIQRGSMHIAQIFKLLSNQTVAEEVLKKNGPHTEEDIIEFLYDEKERLPLKSKRFIKQQITKDASEQEFNAILSGIMNHELGSRHSYIKNNLTDVGKVLHIKEKLFYSAKCNNMNYQRVIELILLARQSKTELNLNTFSPTINDQDQNVLRREIFDLGKKLCGEKNFEIFVQNKVNDRTHDELSRLYKIKKPTIVDIIKDCIKVLKKDEQFAEMFKTI